MKLAALNGDEKNVAGYLFLAGACRVSDFTHWPARTALLGMVSRGLVDRAADGTYRLTVAGRHVASMEVR